jgi:type II secretory pathway pseudopilin PulG
MSVNLLAILAVIGFLAVTLYLGFRAARKQGAAEFQADNIRNAQELERTAVDEITKAPADPASVVEWLRRGGRNG